MIYFKLEVSVNRSSIGVIVNYYSWQQRRLYNPQIGRYCGGAGVALCGLLGRRCRQRHCDAETQRWLGTSPTPLSRTYVCKSDLYLNIIDFRSHIRYEELVSHCVSLISMAFLSVQNDKCVSKIKRSGCALAFNAFKEFCFEFWFTTTYTDVSFNFENTE